MSGLTIGPKFGIIPNRITFSLPMGTSLGEYASENFQIHPTLLFTQPLIQDKFELTLAPKYFIPFCEDCTGNFATNLSGFMGYSSRVRKILYQDGGFGQFSLGFSFCIRKITRSLSDSKNSKSQE